jgi:WD40 repeat protein
MFQIKRIKRPHMGDLKDVVRWREYVVSAGRDRRVAVSEAHTGLVLLRTEEEKGFVNSLAVREGESSVLMEIYAGVQSGEIVMYRVERGEKELILRGVERAQGHAGNVSALALHRGFVISTSWDGSVCVWRAGSVEKLCEMKSGATLWSSAVIERDGSSFYLLSGTTAGELIYHKISLREGGVESRIHKRIPLHSSCIRDLVVVNGFTYTLSNNGVIMKSNEDGSVVERVETDSISFRIFPDAQGKLLCVTSDGGLVRVFDANLNEIDLLTIPALSSWCGCFVGDELLVCGSDGREYLYGKEEDAAARREMERLFGEMESQREREYPGMESTNPNYKVENGKVYHLRSGGWEMVGDVVKKEGSEVSGKFKKAYDHTIDVELDNRTLKLGFNRDEDHESVAKRFLAENNLSEEYFSEIIEFLGKNFSSKTQGYEGIRKRFYVYDTISLEGVKKKLHGWPQSEQMFEIMNRYSDAVGNRDLETVEFINANIRAGEILSLYIGEVRKQEYFPVLDVYKFLVGKGMKFDFSFLEGLDLKDERKNCLVFMRLATNLVAFIPEAIEHFGERAKEIATKRLVDEESLTKYRENIAVRKGSK